MFCRIKIASFILALGSLGLTAIAQVEFVVAQSLPFKVPPIVVPQHGACGYSTTEDQISCLISGLKSSNHLTRRFAAWELGELGEVATEAVPYLINILTEDQGKWERVHACIALGKIGLPIAKVLPSLRLVLEDPDPDIRGYAATALGMVALKLQNRSKAGNLSQADLNIAISELEASLQILQAPNTDFNRETIQRLTTSLDILTTRAKSV